MPNILKLPFRFLRKRKNLQRVFSCFSILSLLLQISSGIFLYQPALAQELTPTPTPVPTITADFTPTPEPTAEPTAEPTLVPTAEPTIEPTIAPTAEPRSEISPEVTPTPTLTEEITPTPTVEENQSTPENEAPPQELSPPTTTPSENPPTQTVTVEPKEDAHLAAAILKDTAAASITELDLDFQAEGSATLKTDKLDYAPTDAVLITGSGFLAGKSYTIYISSSDEPAINYQDSVTADENGNLFYSYQLDGTYRPNYQVIVTNKDGKVIAQTSFTDGNPSGNLDQCSNGASSSPTSPCTWVNGNLNSNQAHYVEGQSVPYRLVMENLPTGTPITVTLGYDIKHSNKHAIDYLTQYNRLEPHTPFGHSAESINPTSGVFGIGATTTTYAIPAPSSIGSPVAGQPTTSFNALPAGEKLMTLFGGTITGISYSSQGSLTASNSESQIDITFTVSNATAVLSWGGHIGSRLDWGFDNGTPRSAGGINGSPYHMRLIDWSINNLGNQDRSLQAGAVIPPGNLTIVKDVVPNDSSVWDFLATGPDSYSHNTNDLGDGGQDVLSVAPGTYTITETTDQNYSTSVICNTGESGGASVSVDISSNEAVICTFVNTLQQVHLTLVKTVTNNNGGTAAVIDWTLSASGPTPISGVSGSGTITNIAVDSGTYTLSESGGPFGYTAGSWSCIKNGGGPVVGSSITLAPNDNAICMISNDDNAVSLILNKVVVNNNGGTALESDWTLSASGPTPISGLGGTGSADVISGPTFSAGTYILSESAGPSGYSASSWVCTGTGSQNGNQITLSLGQSAVCTITNNDIALQLIVIKHVINDNGGTAVASDFTLDSGGANDSPDNFPGAEGLGTTVTLDAGAYNVSETEPAGYSDSYSTDCSGTITVGETKTCTITNDDNAPSLTLVKSVTNDDGGTALTSAWTLTATGPTGFSGTGPTVNNGASFEAGTYDLSESGPAGYIASSWVCVGGNQTDSDTVDIGLGENVTCTITNDDQAPTLKLVKLVTIDNGGTAVVDDWTLSADANSPNDSRNFNNLGGSGVFETVFANVGYDLSESNVTGYSAGSWSCNGGSLVGSTVTLGLNEDVTCTITNDDIAPTLTLVKVVEGGDGVPADWTLTAAGPTGFSGTGPTVNNGASFEAGTYDLSESGPTNYTASDWVCVGGSQTDGDTVEIGLADDVTCTITNTRGSGNITVIKNIDGNNDGDLEDDDVDQANVEGWTWDISGGEQNISMGESRTLITDNYTITEDERTDYAFVSWSCDNDTNGTTNNISLALNNNEEITCEFINTPLTDVHGRKWNDLDGNSERNGEEEFLSNWRIFIDENDNQILDGEEQSTLTDDNGWYVFHNLSPGTYDICEVLQSGWIQTFPTGGSCHAVTVPENSEEDQLQNEILGVPYDFGNQQQNPILTITKSNNAGGNKNPGDGVQFTLVVTALNSSINNVFVYDLPAGGFNYRSGSCMADSTVRGALSCAPTYASPGVWDLGNMVAGEVVTLTYWADISGDQAPGLYKDLAWAKGLSAAEETVMANNDTGYFVGTDVNVVKEQQSGENYNVESEQTVIGQVLGASTSLPATGANSAWLILAVILLGTGLNSLAFGLFLRRKNA